MLHEAQRAVYKATKCERPSVLHVVKGSKLHQAIERGEFREAGIEPGSGRVVSSPGGTPLIELTTEE